MRNKQSYGFFVAALIGGAGAAVCAGQCQKGWKPTDGKPGLDNSGGSLAVWDDGRGPALYMANAFTRIGDMTFTPSPLNVARWNGYGWEALPSALPPGQGISWLAVHGGLLTGSGPSAVLTWNGYGWASLGPPATDQGGPLLSHGGLLYARSRPESPAALRVWNGATWSDTALDPPGATHYSISALASHEGSVCMGGSFSSGGLRSGVARLVGSTYELVGSEATGANPSVNSLQAFNGELVAGEGGGLWRIKGNSWYRFDPPPSNNGNVADAYVRCLGAYAGDLIVGGRFTEFGAVGAVGLARWNTVEWKSLSGGAAASGLQLSGFCEFSGELTVSGSSVFTPLFQYGLARWTGSEWKPIGLGFENAIRCFAVVNSQLHAGGFFRYMGGEPSNHVV